MTHKKCVPQPIPINLEILPKITLCVDEPKVFLKNNGNCKCKRRSHRKHKHSHHKHSDHKHSDHKRKSITKYKYKYKTKY